MTTQIKQIKDILDMVADGYLDDYDTLKLANEIDGLYQEDKTISDNMRDYWIHQADGAEK